MGVSATGDRGIRARTIPILLASLTAFVGFAFYVLGPPVAPGLRDAAREACNEYAGNDFRSYRLEWKLPKHPTYRLPHWSCADVRNLDQEPLDLGWWVNPF